MLRTPAEMLHEHKRRREYRKANSRHESQLILCRQTHRFLRSKSGQRLRRSIKEAPVIVNDDRFLRSSGKSRHEMSAQRVFVVFVNEAIDTEDTAGIHSRSAIASAQARSDRNRFLAVHHQSTDRAAGDTVIQRHRDIFPFLGCLPSTRTVRASPTPWVKVAR